MDDELDANHLNLDFISGSVTIIGTAPLSQSHQHGDPALEGESADDYERRTWRSKLNTRKQPRRGGAGDGAPAGAGSWGQVQQEADRRPRAQYLDQALRVRRRGSQQRRALPHRL